jgi:hypothetical protein
MRVSMTKALTITGIVLILISFHDQFQTMFHPSSSGSLSDWIAHMIWRGFHAIARGPTLLTTAGPIAIFCIILIWAGFIVVGCALIYFPRLDLFAPADAVVVPSQAGFFQAINIATASLVTMSASVTPTVGWLRLMISLEAALGIALVTASISWILSVYPVLEGRSSLAEEAVALHDAEQASGVDFFESPENQVQATLLGLAGQVTTLRNQTVQFPITYYFGTRQRRATLPVILPYIYELAESAAQPKRPPGVRLAGEVLRRAVSSYLELLAERFLQTPSEDRVKVIHAYAADNLRQAVAL